jgi:UDP-N-acetylmuramoyl-L-alanyl-D-glutamate--2,6-diaminopimelate ligase
MKSLKTILEGLPCEVHGSLNIDIEDIVFDSRKVRSGSLFVAILGTHQDGNDFVRSAIQAGAKAILSEKDLHAAGATIIRVQDPSKALAPIALRFWDNPSGALRMVGITGTNGKTTISYLVESIFKVAGWPTGVMGTINYRFGKLSTPAPNTTPLASELQRFLATIVRQNGKACVMEVSSHALELGRVEGVDFDVAVFSNLTQDHLDFHKTMDAYAAAKAKLFASVSPSSTKPFPKQAVINVDDPWAKTMSNAARVPVLKYSLSGPAELCTKNLVCDSSGSRFEMYTPAGHSPVRLPLLGDYNVMNALAAAGAALSQGISLAQIVRGLEGVTGVPGRMERIASPTGFTVVVDYAHSEDALRQVMSTLRKLKPKHLVTVFGCGGDRDRTKRPLMGEAAAQMSDEVIVTSDNPRSEDPSRIALDVEVGVRRVRSDHYQTILDRESAIEKAFTLAVPGDIVLIAGKGHENYQIMSDKTIPFDDREVTKRLLHLPS